MPLGVTEPGAWGAGGASSKNPRCLPAGNWPHHSHVRPPCPPSSDKTAWFSLPGGSSECKGLGTNPVPPLGPVPGRTQPGVRTTRPTRAGPCGFGECVLWLRARRPPKRTAGFSPSPVCGAGYSSVKWINRLPQRPVARLSSTWRVLRACCYLSSLLLLLLLL